MGHGGGGSWIPIASALTYVDAHGGGGLYLATYFGTEHQFINPPTSLALFELTARLRLFDWHSQASMNTAAWWLVPAIMAALAGLALRLAASVVYGHHYGILPALRGGWQWVALALAVLLTANYIGVADATAATHWNFLQSYLMFGVWIMLGLMLRLTTASPSSPQP